MHIVYKPVVSGGNLMRTNMQGKLPWLWLLWDQLQSVHCVEIEGALACKGAHYDLSA